MSELPSISDIFSDDVNEQRKIKGKMDKANFISVPEWACCVTTVAAERLILGLVWKFGKPSTNKKAMGFYAKSKWIEEHYPEQEHDFPGPYLFEEKEVHSKGG